MTSIGSIYKIYNTDDDEVYVGSTVYSLKHRLQQHLSKAKGLPYKSKFYKKICDIGEDKFKIELLETLSFNDRYELYKLENYYIKLLNATLNTIPSPDKDYVYKRDNVEYYLNHKDAILTKSKEYYHNNKAKVCERLKTYRENNQHEIKERKKRYNEEHKDEIREKRSKPFNCECGSQCSLQHQARHFKSKKHINFIKSKEPVIEEPETEVII